MSEMTIKPEDITAALKESLAGWHPSVEAETVGFVAVERRRGCPRQGPPQGHGFGASRVSRRLAGRSPQHR